MSYYNQKGIFSKSLIPSLSNNKAWKTHAIPHHLISQMKALTEIAFC